MNKFLLFSCLYLLGHIVLGQAHVMRNFQANPFLDSTYQAEWFAVSNFAGHNSRGFRSTENAQGWNAQVCSMLEIVRWKGKNSLVIFASMEVNANIYNNIAFNPRGIILQESFAFFRKQDKFVWNIGFTHRSRHEIDSDSPPDDTTPRVGYLPTSRVVILNGLHVEILSNPLVISPKTTAHAWARTEVYSVASDVRYPRITGEQSWDFMRAMTLVGGRLDVQLGKRIGVYNRSWANTAYFTKGEAFKFNYRMEMGAHFKGVRGKAEGFVAREYFFDDLSRPFPQASSVWLIGFRGRGFLLL